MDKEGETKDKEREKKLKKKEARDYTKKEWIERKGKANKRKERIKKLN